MPEPGSGKPSNAPGAVNTMTSRSEAMSPMMRRSTILAAPTQSCSPLDTVNAGGGRASGSGSLPQAAEQRSMPPSVRPMSRM